MGGLGGQVGTGKRSFGVLQIVPCMEGKVLGQVRYGWRGGGRGGRHLKWVSSEEMFLRHQNHLLNLLQPVNQDSDRDG